MQLYTLPRPAAWSSPTLLCSFAHPFRQLGVQVSSVLLLGQVGQADEVWAIDEDGTQRFVGTLPQDIDTFTATPEFIQAVSRSGCVYSWGENPDFQVHSQSDAPLPLPTPLRLHLADTSSTWGRLVVQSPEERSSHIDSRRREPRVSRIDQTADPPDSLRVRETVSGRGVTFYLTSSGVYSVGQLGHPLLGRLVAKEGQSLPRRMSMGTEVTRLSVGPSHCVACTREGQVYTWGRNVDGCLGVEDNEKRVGEDIAHPSLVNMGFLDLPCIVGVLAAEGVSMVFNYRGRVFYWGRLVPRGRVVLDRAAQVPVEASAEGEILPRVVKLLGKHSDFLAMTSSHTLLAIRDLASPSFVPVRLKGKVQDIAMGSTTSFVLCGPTSSLLFTQALAEHRRVEAEALRQEKIRKYEATVRNRGRKVLKVEKSGVASITDVLSRGQSKAGNHHQKDHTEASFPDLKEVGLTSLGLSALSLHNISIDPVKVRALAKKMPTPTLPPINLPSSLPNTGRLVTPSPVLGMAESAIHPASPLDILAHSNGAQARDLWMRSMVEIGEKDLTDSVFRDILRDQRRKKEKEVLAKDGMGEDFSLLKSAGQMKDEVLHQKVLTLQRRVMPHLDIGIRFKREVKESIASTSRLRADISREVNYCDSLVTRINQSSTSVNHTSTTSLKNKISENIMASSKHTKEHSIKKQIEMSRAIKEKILTIAQARQVQTKPSWLMLADAANRETHSIQHRIKLHRQKQKAKSAIKSFLSLVNLLRFLRFCKLTLEGRSSGDCVEIEREDTPIPSPKNMQRERVLKFLSGQERFLEERVEVQQALSLEKVFTTYHIVRLREKTLENGIFKLKAAQRLARFGRCVIKRRLFELCLLTAHFNKHVVEHFKTKENVPPPTPLSNSLLAAVPSLPHPVHLSKTLFWKINVATHYLFAHPKFTLRSLLHALVQELLPFSLHGGLLHFDKSYFCLRKGKSCTDEITSAEEEVKLGLLEALYKQKGRQVCDEIKVYRRQIKEYLVTHARLIDQQRVLYTLRQSSEYLARIYEMKRSELLTGGGLHDTPTSLLPFVGRRFEFAEEVNQHIHRPTLDIGFTGKQTTILLAEYNRQFRHRVDKIKAEYKERRPLTDSHAQLSVHSLPANSSP